MKINKIVKTGISTVLLSSCLLLSTNQIDSPFSSISVEAATVTKYTTTANVNLRSTNSTKGKVLLTIPKGKEVSYIKKSGNWYQVKYNGKTGWVKSTYIKTTKVTSASTKKASSAKTTTKYTTTANVNLRSTSSTKGKVLLTIPKGKKVSYLKKSGNWYQVKYNGKTGWVKSTYIKTTKVTSASTKKASSTKTTTKYTTTANVNLRSTSSTKGKVLLTIPKGKEVSYIKKSGNWYQVKYSGKTGWVKSSYIKSTKVTNTSSKTVSTAKTTTIYTTTANLNLRSTNSTNGKVLLTIPKGKTVTFIKKNGNWYQVKYNGKTGWVSKTYIKETKKTTSTNTNTNTTTNKQTTVYTTTADLNLRSTNSTSGKVLLVIPKGKTVTYIKKSGNWYQVKYNNTTGWVNKSYIKETTKTTSTNTSTTPSNNTTSTQTTKYITTADLNLRKTNSLDGEILLVIPKNKEVTYIKKSGDWYQVKYSGKTGWVSSKYLTTPSNNTTNNSENKSTTGTQNSGTQTPNTNPSVSLPAGNITEMVVYTGTDLNFRESNSTSSKLYGTIPKLTKLTTNYKTSNGWYRVSYNGKIGYVSGTYLISQSTKERIDKLENNKNSYVFMDVRKPSSVTAKQIDDYISSRVGSNRSVLKNTGKYFIEAGKKYGVNPLYLAAHAIHESNFGKSTISLDRYNLFGYGAYDLVPYLGSVKFASIEQNIHFIAQKIKATYLGNSYLNKGTYLGYSVKSITGLRVDSLSKGMNFYYATDPNWGEAIAKHMNNILDYSKEEGKNKSANTSIPSNPSYPDGSDVFPTSTLAIARSQITLYSSKSTSSSAGISIKKGDQFNLLEKDNNYWLKVKYNGKTYYAKIAFNAYNSYFTVKNLGRVSVGGEELNLREKSNTSSSVLTKLKHKQYVELVLDKNQKPIKENNFYKVKANGKEGWASASYIVQELNK